MATFIRRKNKAGSMAVTAQIRITAAGVDHHESKTFSSGTDQQNERNAQAWAKRREAEIQVNGIPQPESPITLAELITNYVEEFGDRVRMGRSKRADLERLKGYDFAKRPVSKLVSADYVQHITSRLNDGAQPQTANNDLVWTGVLLQFGRAAHGCKPIMDELEAAKAFLRSNSMIARSDKRERLPTVEEFRKLVSYYTRTQYRREMLQIILFAMTSARRLSEITRIQWADNNDQHQTGLVRDLKDPRKKDGNDQRFNYTPEAWKLVQARERGGELIFPHDPKSLSANFTRACQLLEIEDLHFHDFRHFATSWLFWQGLSIQQVSEITLHMSWETLKRYTHMGRAEQELISQLHEELQQCLTLINSA